jgi:hypothetical protein
MVFIQIEGRSKAGSLYCEPPISKKVWLRQIGLSFHNDLRRDSGRFAAALP